MRVDIGTHTEYCAWHTQRKGGPLLVPEKNSADQVFMRFQHVTCVCVLLHKCGVFQTSKGRCFGCTTWCCYSTTRISHVCVPAMHVLYICTAMHMHVLLCCACSRAMHKLSHAYARHIIILRMCTVCSGALYLAPVCLWIYQHCLSVCRHAVEKM